MLITEPEWKRIVTSLARVRGWRVGIGSPAHSDPGFPDLTLIHPDGRVMFVELKTDRGAVSREQRQLIAAARDAGVDAHIWRPRQRAEVETLLDGKRVDKPTPGSRFVPLVEPGEIIDYVADAYGLTTDELLAPTRVEPIVIPRQIAMTVCRELTSLSLPAIGRHFGRDHTTVINAVNAVNRRRAGDELFDERFTAIVNNFAPKPPAIAPFPSAVHTIPTPVTTKPL